MSILVVQKWPPSEMSSCAILNFTFKVGIILDEENNGYVARDHLLYAL